MARHGVYRHDADCGCSLTACHDGPVASPVPMIHQQAVLGPEIQRRYGGSDNRGAWVGFRRLLGLEGEGDLTAEEGFALRSNLALPDDWKALIRGAVRDDPHMDCDEEKDFYRVLDLGVPSPGETAAWYVYIGHFH